MHLPRDGMVSDVSRFFSWIFGRNLTVKELVSLQMLGSQEAQLKSKVGCLSWTQLVIVIIILF